VTVALTAALLESCDGKRVHQAPGMLSFALAQHWHEQN
jgi:hypothetical protein